MPGMPPVDQQNGKGCREECRPERAWDHRAPDVLDRQLEEREAEASEQKPAQVEPRWRRCAEILDEPEGQDDAGDPDWQVQIKDRPPGKIRRQEAADDRPYGRPD